jgi:hypothetical protein
MAAAQFKLRIKRGQRAQDVVVAAGTTISGSDALELNVDQTIMSKGECLQQIDEIVKQIHQSPWPQTVPA